MKTRSIAGCWVLAICAALCVGSAAARAQTSARLDLGTAAAALASDPKATEAPISLDSKAHLAYTSEGSHWGAVGFGLTQSVTGKAIGYNPTFSYTYFMIDAVEITGELGGWYYNQPGTNAFGINPCAVLRWHFWRSEDLKTTVYLDGGIGVALFSDKVPATGTNFDFTPRFGVGLTRQITDEGLRLQVGLRWNHVSNARILGDSQNPARDGPMLYFGLIFPF